MRQLHASTVIVNIVVLCSLPVIYSLDKLFVVKRTLDNQSNLDYKDAVNGDLLNVVSGKAVTLEEGTNCNFDAERVRTIQAYPPTVAITDSTFHSGTSYRVTCDSQCSSDRVVLTDITDSTPTDGDSKLRSGQNVLLADVNSVTYILTLSATSLAATEGTELFTILVDRVGSPTTVSASMSPPVDDTFNLKIISDDGRKKIPLELAKEYHITVMVSKDDSLAILVNTKVILHYPGSTTSFTLNTDASKYVQDWKVYNQHLTSQELHKVIDSGVEINVEPAGQCNCPRELPFFDRWPRSDEDIWSGVTCTSLNGTTTDFRVDSNSHNAQFIADGNELTFWVSDTNIALSKLTVDLGTTYQIFYAELTVITVPKHLVITKTVEGSAEEDVLYVATDNCSDSATLPNGLPQGKALHCETELNFFESSARDIFGIVLLNWANKILFPGLVPDKPAFNAAVEAGKFNAKSISIYMYGHEAASDMHSINELKVFGSCGCSENGVCSLSKPIQNGGRGSSGASGASFAAAIPTLPTGYEEMNLGYTFKQTYGYECNCTTGHQGDLCYECVVGRYQTADGCATCNCGVGSYNSTCDANGQCYCNTRGISRPDLVNKKCHPFIHSLEPSYGPIAGGTTMVARGGWLSNVAYINVGGNKCYPPEGSVHNDTHFSCLTLPVETAGQIPVFTDQTGPMVNFTYKPNPNITVIGRVEVTTRGGVDIPIAGTNLDSIANPKIEVTIICKPTQEAITSLQGDCKALNSEEMNCKSPDFTGALENSRCVADPDPGQLRRRRAIDEEAELYEFVIGFVLDGVEEFEDASESPWLEKSSQMVVRADPVVNEFSDSGRVKILEANEHLELSGNNMQSGTQIEDYTIVVGTGECVPTVLYHNLVKCELPADLPPPGKDYAQSPYDSEEKIPAVVVNIGNIATQVGYVVRKVVADEKPNIVVPVVVSVVVVVLLVVVAVVVVCIRRKRHIKVKRLRNSTKLNSRYVLGPHGKGLPQASDYLDPEHMENLQDRLIPLDHLELGNALGQGQFGKVFAGTLLMKSGAKKKVAVKTMRVDLLRTDMQAIPNFLQEAILMKDFDHANVLSLIGVVLNEENIPMVIIPLMTKGDLKRVLRDENEDFMVGDLLHFGLQAAYGMNYLAQKKFIHRDLAARNCMVDEHYMVKIADFGLSHDIYAEDYYRVQDKSKPLPVKWMAFESLASGRYTVESDVWSYGILLWEILTRGDSPYPGVNNYDIKDFLRIGKRLDQPDYCPDEVYALMCACWDLTPTDRPRFDKICEILSSFMDDEGEYSRNITSQIEDDYLVQHSAEDDSPIYTNQSPTECPPPDYDVPEPAFEAPKSPSSDKDEPSWGKLNKNSNNSNSNIRPTPSKRGNQQSTDSDIEYLQPVPSIKKPGYYPTPMPRSTTSAPSSKSLKTKQQGPKRQSQEYIGMKLANPQDRSKPNNYTKPNNYLHIY